MSDNLTPSMRRAVNIGLEAPEPRSVPSLTAALRKARIDNGILQRKLDAMTAKLARYEASKALAAELASDAEGTCL